MKNYYEMAQDVLRRMDEYETAKRKRNARLVKGAVSLCCCALVLLLGIGVQHSGFLEPEVPVTLGDALYPGIPDVIDDRQTAAPVTSETVENIGDRIFVAVNEMAAAPETDSMGIALMCDDFIGMDRAELNAYYGTNVFPTVPTDLQQQDEQFYGIFCRDGGQGEIYWDQNAFDYFNEDLTRWVCVTVSKDSLPYCFMAFQDEDPQKSVISGTEVVIGQWDTVCYYAEFMCRDVGFRITAQGLTQDELVAVIASLIP